ncbi:MAG: hypothetical protein AB1473_15430 [Thermodesulfobacteriota bacterium]
MSLLKSQYKTEALTCRRTRDGLDIWFADQDRQIAELCMSEITEARDHVEAFFDYRPNVKLFIFMYPNLSAMNKAFGRELPHENCCFVPIKGPESLIAFVTPRSNLSSLKVILAHEYCHIVFGCLTGNRETGPTEQRIPMWLDEGVALFVDRKFRDNFHEVERDRLERVRLGADGWWPNLEDLYTYFNRLDGEKEFGRRGSLAYAYSYFCVKELIRRFDEQAFVQFAGSLASSNDIPSLFHQIFGLSVGQFNSEMKSSLGQIEHACDFTQETLSG